MIFAWQRRCFCLGCGHSGIYVEQVSPCEVCGIEHYQYFTVRYRYYGIFYRLWCWLTDRSQPSNGWEFRLRSDLIPEVVLQRHFVPAVPTQKEFK